MSVSCAYVIFLLSHVIFTLNELAFIFLYSFLFVSSFYI